MLTKTVPYLKLIKDPLFKSSQYTQKYFSEISNASALKETHLTSYHKDILKAKMVPFAGYSMPVSYPDGIIKEHLHCRKNVGLFDVSHMGKLKCMVKMLKPFWKE